MILSYVCGILDGQVCFLNLFSFFQISDTLFLFDFSILCIIKNTGKGVSGGNKKKIQKGFVFNEITSQMFWNGKDDMTMSGIKGDRENMCSTQFSLFGTTRSIELRLVLKR